MTDTLSYAIRGSKTHSDDVYIGAMLGAFGHVNKLNNRSLRLQGSHTI
jgi:hypothetical protein